MNPKIAQHQQRNAQTRLRQRYAFLNIGDIQSTDGNIARRFVNSGIYRIDRPAAARFPFHQNGEIDRAFHQTQHQAARAETVRRILALHAGHGLDQPAGKRLCVLGARFAAFLAGCFGRLV